MRAFPPVNGLPLRLLLVVMAPVRLCTGARSDAVQALLRLRVHGQDSRPRRRVPAVLPHLHYQASSAARRPQAATTAVQALPQERAQLPVPVTAGKVRLAQTRKQQNLSCVTGEAIDVLVLLLLQVHGHNYSW